MRSYLSSKLQMRVDCEDRVLPANRNMEGSHVPVLHRTLSILMEQMKFMSFGICTCLRILLLGGILGLGFGQPLLAQGPPPKPVPESLDLPAAPATGTVNPSAKPVVNPPTDPAKPPDAAPAAVPAATPVVAATQVADQVTMADLDELKKKVEAATEVMDEQKKSILETIELARAELAQSADNVAAFKSWQQKTADLEAARLKAQANLDAILRERSSLPPDLDSLPKLEQFLASKQQELLNAQNELSQAEKRLTDRTARQKAIKDRLVALPADLESNSSELAKLSGSTELPLQLDAKRFRVLAARKRMETESPSLQAESAFLSAQEAANLLQLSRQEWSAKVARLKNEVSNLQRDVLRKRSSEAKDRAAVALGDAEHAELLEIKAIYEDNVEIVEKEIEFREKEKKLTEEIAESKTIADWIKEKHKDLAERKEKIGSSKSFGIRLRNERQLLPNLKTYRDQINSRVQINQDAQLSLIDVTGKVSALNRIDHNVTATMQQILAKMQPSDDSEELRNNELYWAEQVRSAYEQQHKYLTELQNANEGYVSTLDQLDSSQFDLVTATESFRKFIDENILWVPTNNVLNFQESISDSTSVRLLFSIQEWTSLGRQLFQDAMRHKAMYVAAIVLSLILIFSQRKQRASIRSLGQKASSRLNTSMSPTWLAIFWTVVSALIVPFPFFFLSWRANEFHGSSQLLGTYVFNIAVWLFWLELVYYTSRERGLGVAHFQWPERVNKVIQRQVSYFIVFATPVILALVVIQSRSHDNEAFPLRRVSAVIFYMLLAYALHRLTSRKAGVLREWIELHPGGWLDRLAGMWNVLTVSLPVGLAGLTIAGYTYAVGQLSVRLALTFMVMFAAIFAKSLLVRWLTLRQRRMAIDHAREVRAALAESESREDGSSAVKMEAQEVRTNLIEVSLQSKRLLNTSVAVIAMACIWYIWIDVLPALQRLDEFKLQSDGISLAKLLSAGLLALLFTTAARNIPGLLEMLLLERLPLDRSVRYAIGALTRYFIVIVGMATVARAIGIEWNDVQWLAAALTFGLGFGLQEIFANFISGLIILFEQPVRVGDVVTIDAVTGTVSRIRIRSTTITDWDRKEYIVPNKEFITGKLLNWTLTDSMNRITLNVGVPHSADPVQVRELLYKIVRTQPTILVEPSPMVAFEGFGDNKLNFVIRAFLPTLDNRIETTHQVNVRIHQEFARLGIEIPVPQQDLHIRNSVPLSVQQLNGSSQQRDEQVDVETNNDLHAAYQQN